MQCGWLAFPALRGIQSVPLRVNVPTRSLGYSMSIPFDVLLIGVNGARPTRSRIYSSPMVVSTAPGPRPQSHVDERRTRDPVADHVPANRPDEPSDDEPNRPANWSGRPAYSPGEHV